MTYELIAVSAVIMADHLGGLVAETAIHTVPPPAPYWFVVAFARWLSDHLDILTDSLSNWMIYAAALVVVFGVWSAVKYPEVSTRFGRRR